jgi:hypothetical protein
MEGYIYHLRNDAMPGLANWDCKNVLLECNRYTTGVPMMFDCICAKSQNMRQENLLFSLI